MKKELMAVLLLLAQCSFASLLGMEAGSQENKSLEYIAANVTILKNALRVMRAEQTFLRGYSELVKRIEACSTAQEETTVLLDSDMPQDQLERLEKRITERFAKIKAQADIALKDPQAYQNPQIRFFNHIHIGIFRILLNPATNIKTVHQHTFTKAAFEDVLWKMRNDYLDEFNNALAAFNSSLENPAQKSTVIQGSELWAQILNEQKENHQILAKTLSNWWLLILNDHADAIKQLYKLNEIIQNNNDAIKIWNEMCCSVTSKINDLQNLARTVKSNLPSFKTVQPNNNNINTPIFDNQKKHEKKPSNSKKKKHTPKKKKQQKAKRCIEQIKVVDQPSEKSFVKTEITVPEKRDLEREKQIYFLDLPKKKPTWEYAERILAYFKEYTPSKGVCVQFDENKSIDEQINAVHKKLDHLIPQVIDSYLPHICIRTPWEKGTICHVALARIHYLASNDIRDCFFTLTTDRKQTSCWHRSIIGHFLLPKEIEQKMGNKNTTLFNDRLLEILREFAAKLTENPEQIEQRPDNMPKIDKAKGINVAVFEGNETVVIKDRDMAITLYKLPRETKEELESLCWSIE